ncbi:MAG: 4Fe-4S binding protein [Anaerolineae bacterium]
MPRGLSYFYLLPHLIKSLCQKPITIAYPHGDLDLPEGYRGTMVVDISLCGGCGLCARDCPANALEVERSSNKGVRVVLYNDRCISCGQCALVCKRNAVQLTSAYRSAEVDRTSLKSEWEKKGTKAGSDT